MIKEKIYTSHREERIGIWQVYLIVLMAVIFDQRFGNLGPIRVELLINLMLSLFSFIIFLIYGRASLMLALKRVGFFGALYIFYLGMTSLWSFNATNTILQVGVFTIFVLFSFSMRYTRADLALTSLVRALGVLAVACWIFLLIAGDMALSHKDVAWRLRGLLDHEQRLALFMAQGLILLTVLRLNSVVVPYSRFWAFMFIVTIFATQARAFIAFLILIEVLILFSYVRWLRLVVLSAIGPLLVLGLGLSSAVVEFFSRGESDLTLTGRTSIWAYALENWRNAPILGHGHASFLEFVGVFPVFANYTPPHAHNTFIHSLFEVGVVGAALLAAWIVSLALKPSPFRPSPSFWIVMFAIVVGTTGIIFGEKMSGALLLTLFVVAVNYRPLQIDGLPTLPHNRRTKFRRYSTDEIIVGNRTERVRSSVYR